jgi:hypothetical protein
VGSHVTDGLVVDGVCILDRVAVEGGLAVDTGGHLQVQSSTVNGGIVVNPGGELDVNAITPASGVPTGTSAAINEGITINDASETIWTARIHAGIIVNGSGGAPLFCGNDVRGAASFKTSSCQIGGGVVVPGYDCSANTFQGSVSLTDSTAQMGGNTIRGDLLCSNSVVIVLTPNTITGRNTCYERPAPEVH